jgi:uncharacterized membrane protein
MAVPWTATKLAGTIGPFAQAVPKFDPWSLWWQYLILLAVALVGIVVLYLITRWRKQVGARQPSASEQLSEFREMYEQGQLSREEFDRLRNLLGERMRREMEGKSAAPTAAPPEPRPPVELPPRPEPPDTSIQPG